MSMSEKGTVILMLCTYFSIRLLFSYGRSVEEVAGKVRDKVCGLHSFGIFLRIIFVTGILCLLTESGCSTSELFETHCSSSVELETGSAVKGITSLRNRSRFFL